LNIKYEENLLTAKQFLELRKSVEWTGDEHQVEKSLEADLYDIIATDGEKIIGMGRLVGDGFLYWYVQDVIVTPQYQGYGIGKTIMEYLFRYIEKNSLPDTTVTIGLMAAKGKDAFYEKLGFTARPNDIYGSGMIKNHLIPNTASAVIKHTPRHSKR